jgi:hypothetical protein
MYPLILMGPQICRAKADLQPDPLWPNTGLKEKKHTLSNQTMLQPGGAELPSNLTTTNVPGTAKAGYHWLTPVILAIQEAEIRRMDSSFEIVQEPLS